MKWTGKRLKRSTKNNVFSYSLVVVAYVVLQICISGGNISSALQGQLVPISAYVVMAISLNLTVGVLGELSLGHAGFMSVGAFSGVVAAVAMESLIPIPGLRLAVAMVVGAVCAGLVGTLVGVPVLRLNGDYLAIVTLAFGEIIKSIINNLYIGIDGQGLHMSMLENTVELAEGGKMVITGPMGAGNIPQLASFLAGVVLILVTLFVVLNLIDSRAGRAIMALRDNRIAAESVGIGVTKYKLMAFVTSAALAGAAGTLFATNYSTVVANKFDFNTSILVLVFVVLGGLGNIWGSMVAAAALTVLPELLRKFSDYRMLVYAVVLILVMLATNNMQLRTKLGRLLRWRPKKASAQKSGRGDKDHG